MADLTKLNDAELEAHINDLVAQQRDLKAQKMAAQQEFARRNARARVGSMNDAERAALAQALQAQGIGSGEAFGQAG